MTEAAVQATPRRRPISKQQIETVVSRSVAIFGLLFGAQTFPVMLGQLDKLPEAWAWTINIVIFGSLLFSVVASVLKSWVRTANLVVAFAYLVALSSWPLAVNDPSMVAGERPWLWFLCTVATAAAAVAMPVWMATAYLILAPTVYGVIRLFPSGGGAKWDLAAIDTLYAIILGGAVLVLITLLRQAAAGVDAAQSTALSRYSHAVRQHATEVERVQVDSIVHDSVLTTLLEAARAHTPDAMELSSRMAANAIGHLQEAQVASPDDESTIDLHKLAARISDAARTLSAPIEVRIRAIGSGSVPVQTAEALYSAAMQAMVNSMQHAGNDPKVLRWVAIRGIGEDGIHIEVGDTGVGFDFVEVPTERLGLRVSIIERVANIGGAVDVDSSQGEGTVITITWPEVNT